MCVHWYSPPFWEPWLKVSIFQSFWPVMLIRRSLNLEYFEDLVDFRVAYEQGFPLSHLCEDAPNGPYVDRSRVFFGSQQDLRGPIP